MEQSVLLSSSLLPGSCLDNVELLDLIAEYKVDTALLRQTEAK